MFFNFSFDDHKQQRRQKRIDRRPERLSKIKSEKLSKRVNLRSIARYAVMPEILPRVRNLGMHFGHFAYLIALVLNSARLIPNRHPTLNPQMIGHYGVRDVLALAANNIQWRWKNVDQIAIFTAIVTGLIMVLIQAVLIALYAFTGTAQAQESVSFFSTPEENVQTDVVLIFLDQVFGANLEIFGAASQPTGTPVYIGLQKILGLYSMATMVIAVIIVLYYILTVIGEAAKTGTPFGQRFNSLWAPIRLVVALGLLVPLGSGLNSAQYLTLFTAKMGSGLATQVWTKFTQEITGAKDIVSKPPSASTTYLVSRIFLSEVCAAAYNQVEKTSAKNNKIQILQGLNGMSIPASFNNPGSMINAAKKANMGKVDISWSRNNAGETATDYACGHITISLAEFDYYIRANGGEGEIASQDENLVEYIWGWVRGARDIKDKIGTVHSQVKSAYIREIGNIANSVRPAARALAEYHISINPTAKKGDKAALDAADISGSLKKAAINAHTNVNQVISTSYQTVTQASYGSSKPSSGIQDEMIKRGWGAAGMWYGNIGKINQKFMEAVNSAAPTLGTLFDAPGIKNPGRDGNAWFWGIFGGISGKAQEEIGTAINDAQKNYTSFILDGVLPENEKLYQEARLESAHNSGKDAFVFALIWAMGGGDLFDLKENPNLDPMARIASAGHNIIRNSMYTFFIGSALGGVSLVAGVGGDVLGGLTDPTGATDVAGGVAKIISGITGAAATLFFTLTAIGLVGGIFLAFVIPFLPFVYFSFAVIGWVLELFEAIIAMPLWALAHLRIDGEGMTGPAALGGYELLLMILLRPALIVFGLIGGYVIFGGAMYYFTTLFNAATTITQHDVYGTQGVGGIGVFVYTVIFVFLTYNIAIMCFKLIDDVPKGILRWMGSNAQPFSDSRGDPINGSREAVIGTVAGATMFARGFQGAGGQLRQAGRDYSSTMKGKKDQTGSQGEHRGVSPQGHSYQYGQVDPSFQAKQSSSPPTDMGKTSGQGKGTLGPQWKVDPNKPDNKDDKDKQ